MADTKISDLTAIASVAGEDLLAFVDDPSGTPATVKGTVTQLATFLDANTSTLTNKTLSAPTYSGLQDLSSATLRVPLSATPTMAVDGDFAIDTTVTDLSHGLLKYYDGEEMGVVAMPIAQYTTPTDGYVVAYNATNDEFELVVQSGGISNVVEDTTPQLGGALDGQGNDITGIGVLTMVEQAAAEADVAGRGQWWVQTAVPNLPMFTNDAGTDYQLATLTGTETLTNKTINTSSNTITVNEADISDLGTTVAMVADNLSVFAATTSAQLAGVISDETGSGSLVFGTSPTLGSPVLTTPQINDTSADHQYIFGVSELTLDRTVTLPLLTGNDTFVFEAHSQTLTNKTINTASNTITVSEGDISDLGTLAAMVADDLSVFAATTSAQLAGVISDETGSGSLVFATSPTLVTPVLGTPTSGTLTNCTGYTIANLASGTSADLAGVISDETGTGVVVFGTSPTFTTKITTDPIFINESAAASADVIGDGQIWVKNDTPNTLQFTDDAGTDFQIATLTGTETLTNKTINTASNTITVAEADISDLGTTVAMVADDLSVFAATSSAQLAGVISDETGSGALVFGTSPTISTPTLTLKQSAAPAPTAEGDIQWDTDDNTIKIGDGATTKTFSSDADISITESQISDLGTTVAMVADNLSVFAATTSAQLAGVISDETGSGLLVFGTSPTIVTPTIASFTNATHDHSNAAGGGQIAASTALSDYANLALVAGDVYTGTHDFGGADDFEIPNSATPTVDTNGQIAIDTTITDFSMGLIKYYSGEEMAVVAMPIAELTTPTDGHFVAYNATNDEFELKAGAGGADDLGNHTATQDLDMAGFNIDNADSIFIDEKAAAEADVAGHGQIWVKNTTPNELWFTDDAGTDVQLGAGGGGDLTQYPIPCTMEVPEGTVAYPDVHTLATASAKVSGFVMPDGASASTINFKCVCPTNLAGTPAMKIRVRIMTMGAVAGPADVRLTVSTVGIADTEALDTALTAETETTVTMPTATETMDYYTQDLTTDWVAGDTIIGQLKRDPTDVADDFTDDILIVGIDLLVDLTPA